MKRILNFFFIIFLFSDVYSQVHGGIYVKENFPSREVTPYQHIREGDMMWSKKIWRIIDLRQKINHPLYYPTEPQGGFDDRKSLIDLIIYGVKNEGLNIYSPDNPYSEFKIPMTHEELIERLGGGIDSVPIENLETGLIEYKPVPKELRTSEVKEFLVLEGWFIDRKRSVLEARILGLCPVRCYYREDDIDQENQMKKLIGWVYFPQARYIFSKNQVFNPHNSSEHRTFDDIFHKRLFSSFIVKIENTYNNRNINSYTIGLKAILEGEKISENQIRKAYSDLWEQ